MTIDRRQILLGLGGLSTAALLGVDAGAAQDLTQTRETGSPPEEPLVYDPRAEGGRIGVRGGRIVTLVPRARDIRYLSTMAYTRLVGYDRNLDLTPDLLRAVDSEGGRVFTLHLRKGHRWSDGAPFTAEDFRYWWEDVALHRDLNPAGPPMFMLAAGEPPRFEVLDALTVRYTWEVPNPRFLPALAGPRDALIYSPAHYLRQFHSRYAGDAELARRVASANVRSWAALHNRYDAMGDEADPDMPTVYPWRVTNAGPASRFVFRRNPYYHRVDPTGQQLPYVDEIVVDLASPGLFAAKANAGEVDLMSRGLNMADIPVLKQGEKAHGYRTLMWPIARGSEVALYPNLTAADPVWRALNRDVRFRRALSLGIDRNTLNNALFFGLGTEGNNTVREGSRLFRPEYRSRFAQYDPAAANALLDEAGLAARGPGDVRLLPDGRILEIVVEVEGDAAVAVDALQLITEFWRDIGVKLFIKPQDRTVLRNRSYSGLPVMIAAPGLDNAMPTEIMPPTGLAPVYQDNYAWPKWGQYMETGGKVGEACDMEVPRRLLALYGEWLEESRDAVKTGIWHQMLEMHADEQWIIGTVAGALQPIVLRDGLRNLPEDAVYSWEPTAMIGVYRIDALFWDDAGRRGQAPS
ncbi:peptide/nickel transport system substrate-binding protein [Pseudochelatococcus lubricantis]|uniref:Peptide/nickel transport system substrate-binding protein n=1 Tax=Pseudochelatococcus lubricantis TaxID=1538102 RepID=A0ABX0UXP5_9HYPH|nr:ABC transporter substrate-binding protein [Pseudochelatococcus lubricantis]NIJ56640.1 peptide/nickel transport system substrate-binding protein [Pseudochelatococcus lubricantis]